jgi:hypothetical protein
MVKLNARYEVGRGVHGACERGTAHIVLGLDVCTLLHEMLGCFLVFLSGQVQRSTSLRTVRGRGEGWACESGGMMA